MSFYLFAETAFHHEGDKNYLLKLVDEAYKSGAHGVKFQILIDLDEFMSSRHSAFEMARNWVLSVTDWEEVLNYTISIGLDIIAMPLDTSAFKVISKFPIKYIEVHSVSFKDDLILESLDRVDTPLILGVGGRTKDEIEQSVVRYSSRALILMVGFQAFPTEFKSSKIGRVAALKELYPDCKIGYADHSAFDNELAIKSSEYAYLLGARIFEKHLTMNEGEERIDFQSAVGSSKFSQIKKNLEDLEQAYDSNQENVFEISTLEQDYRNRQKVPVTKEMIPAGTLISEDSLCMKLIDKDACIKVKESLIGKLTSRDIAKDEAFLVGDLM